MKFTLEELASHIKNEQYHIFNDTNVTVCCLTLDNEFSVIGYSSCIDKENFNKELGEKYAKENAKEKLWELYVFLSKELSQYSNSMLEEFGLVSNEDK